MLCIYCKNSLITFRMHQIYMTSLLLRVRLIDVIKKSHTICLLRGTLTPLCIYILWTLDSMVYRTLTYYDYAKKNSNRTDGGDSGPLEEHGIRERPFILAGVSRVPVCDLLLEN